MKDKNKIKTLKYKEEQYFIYGLYDDDSLVYIGFTKNIENRIKEHLNSINRKIANLAYRQSYDLDIRVIAIFYDKDLALEYEAILINRYIDNLYNKKDEKHRL